MLCCVRQLQAPVVEVEIDDLPHLPRIKPSHASSPPENKRDAKVRPAKKSHHISKDTPTMTLLPRALYHCQ